MPDKAIELMDDMAGTPVCNAKKGLKTSLQALVPQGIRIPGSTQN
jgi:hypothetical protein